MSSCARTFITVCLYYASGLAAVTDWTDGRTDRLTSMHTDTDAHCTHMYVNGGSCYLLVTV
jgi:hypothetical protein